MNKFKEGIENLRISEDGQMPVDMQIARMLQEQGKTISDMDRNLIKQMLASGNSPEVVIKTILGQSGKTMSNMDRQMLAGGGTPFPDLTGDGQITQADILKGRGVYAQGGEAIDDELAGMQMSEEDAMAEIQGIAPQAKMIEQLVMAVMQMVQQGIGEQEIIDFLKEQGLDEEDIEDLFTMVMQQMQQGQEDPIASELQEMN